MTSQSDLAIHIMLVPLSRDDTGTLNAAEDATALMRYLQ